MIPIPKSGDTWEADLERERQTQYEHAAASGASYGLAGIDETLALPDPPQKRSERETSRVLALLDELERGSI